MSSSIERATHVLRGAPVEPMPELVDLDALSGASRRAVDPTVVAEAEARGYADGHGAGYQDGYDAGRRAALDEAERAAAGNVTAIESALAALGAAAIDLSACRGADLADAEDSLVAGAFELATAVLGRELQLADAPGRDALARALRLADSREPVLARLHPDDVATLGDHTELAPGRDVTVVADETVERGGCLVELGDGRIDARLSTALERVKAVLAP